MFALTRGNMEDIESKCRKTGDCLIWSGAIDKQSGHAVARLEGWHQKVIYWLWRREWKLELAKGKALENLCGNKLCMCKEHWRVARPKPGNFEGSMLWLQFVKGLDLPCSHVDACKAVVDVLTKLNRSGAIKDACMKVVNSPKDR